MLDLEFRINKINAKEENFTIKEINATETQLIVTTGRNIFQYRMPRNLKVSHVHKSHTLSRKTALTIRNLSWPKSKEKMKQYKIQLRPYTTVK